MNKYAEFTNIRTGFNPHIIKRLRHDVSFEQLKAYKKYLILLIKIKSGLVCSKLSDKLVGFTELGNIYEELNQFQRIVSGKMVPKRLATHVLCIMARGLDNHINYPIVYFSSCRFDSDQL